MEINNEYNGMARVGLVVCRLGEDISLCCTTEVQQSLLEIGGNLHMKHRTVDWFDFNWKIKKKCFRIEVFLNISIHIM